MTLKEFAKILKLSPTTVSRALMGYSDVSPKTRQRVLRMAEHYKYTPNTTAARLKRGKADVVGLFLPSQPGAFEDPFFLKLIAGIGEQLAERENDLLLLAPTEKQKEIALLEKMVRSNQVDGVILARPTVLDARVEFLIDHNFPFVCHGRTQGTRPYAYLDIDGKSAFHEACLRLVHFGHRRIAFLNAKPNMRFALDRFAGYKQALEEAGIPFDINLVLEGQMNESFGREASQSLMQQAVPPTAFLCATDRIAIGALRGIQLLGLQAGTDISIIGYDDLPMSSHCTPPLTTLHQLIPEAGKRMTEMLFALIDGHPIEGLQEIWQATLIKRESDGPVTTR